MRWGHSVAAISEDRLVIIGGTDGQVLESVDVLHNLNNLCSLATTESQCQLLSGCFPCGNLTDDSLIGCFAENICTELGGELLSPSFLPSVRCNSFTSCKECLITEASRTSNCTWCICDNATTCTLPSDCSCHSGDSETPDILCMLDECDYPSCQECQSNSNCTWFGVRNTTASSSTLGVGHCLRSPSNNSSFGADINSSINECPTSCTKLTSCSQCVSSKSSHSGSLGCVWATYSSECMSKDSIPLLCISGICGVIIHSLDQCKPTCSERKNCRECQSSPECVWLPTTNAPLGQCFNVVDVNSSVEKLKCHDCHGDCQQNGQCLRTGECLCNFGFVGVACTVPCLCNGFSNCANETETGRSHCLECLNNTQVRLSLVYLYINFGFLEQ